MMHFVKDMLEYVLVEIYIKIDGSFLRKGSQIFYYQWLNCQKNNQNYCVKDILKEFVLGWYLQLYVN